MKLFFLRLAWGVPGLFIALIVWWLATRSLDGIAALFAPAAAFASLWEMLWHGNLLAHSAVSLQRVAIGLLLALLIGIPIGLLIGCFAALERLSMPVMQLLRMISPLSWMPVAVMALGIGDRPVWFLLTFAAVWPMIINTASGVKHLHAGWLMLARSLSATPLETLWHIILPGILSHLLTGIRLAIGILWIVLVPCEMLGVSSGLGYAILDARDRLAYSELMAVIVTIGVIGFAMDGLARLLIQRYAIKP
ncbi:ABC transporter permease [Brenneria tiliae]|uniref:ABC transporter permease n=1 Tax=Brenneria tiliae TaxID=2914984 RepID=UPI002014ACED|nr:ABC transporter permease [Brenneria tiliae]MCL2896904.1 ABC transporter permease [Brenneria tiliae]MCL2901462.1 ABC transporter permease [Brenneria tiliae]